MDFWQFLSGMIRITVTSADPEAVLQTLTETDIVLYSTEMKDELTVSFWVARKELSRTEALCYRKGYEVTICKKKGLYFIANRILNRPVIAAGILFLLVMSFILPTRILFIRVDGNNLVPDNRILEAAAQAGICFGASREQVRSEKVKNTLLEEIDDLQWGGVNTYGCVAVISVKEREIPEASVEPNESMQISSIVATRDGLIQSCTVTRGSALCRQGQAVKAGQVLISGYTDCGLYISGTRAEGEIFACTTRELTAVTPAKYQSRGEEHRILGNISIILGKKRINLWKDSGIWGSGCGRMYEEYYITLPGGFTLPLAVSLETYLTGELEDVQIPQADAQRHLSDFSESYLRDIMISGSVLSEQSAVSCMDGVFRVENSYICLEMIGREIFEKIGEIYG